MGFSLKSMQFQLRDIISYLLVKWNGERIPESSLAAHPYAATFSFSLPANTFDMFKFCKRKGTYRIDETATWDEELNEELKIYIVTFLMRDYT